MALIRATCRDCGDVELRSRDFTVRTCEEWGESTYHFRCPVCRMTDIKAADEQVVDILAASGVKCVTWRLPLELFEDTGDGPLITHDDILDLHELLADPNDAWYFTLVSMTSK